MIADQTQPPLGVEPFAVEGDDARRFLTAVLQRVQPERRQRGGLGMAENAEHAALFVQPVGVEDRSRRRSRFRNGGRRGGRRQRDLAVDERVELVAIGSRRSSG